MTAPACTCKLHALKALIKRAESPAPACMCKLHDDVVCVAQACCRSCAKAAR